MDKQNVNKGIGEQELNVLKIIAETLNRSNDLEHILQTVLNKLLNVTGFTSGWIFLADERPRYQFIASSNLPPALSRNQFQPMCKGTCHCLNDYWRGKLLKPVNIIECKRLNDAVKYKWGNTNNISHHATIPLSAGQENLGVLNVASPGKKQFNESELNLLQSVAYQIGTAIKRIKLYHSKKQRAENFEKLDELIRFIWGISSDQKLFRMLVEKCIKVFPWNVVAIYISEGKKFRLQAQICSRGSIMNQMKTVRKEDLFDSFEGKEVMINKSARKQLRLLGYPEEESCIIAPLQSFHNKHRGMILIAGKREVILSESMIDVIKALTDHMSLAMESIRINKKKQELLLYEERNRLARDLHDSVNQKLFSLSLLSRGFKEFIPTDNELLMDTINNMEQLSQEALHEMKSLIWQLRPTGIEEGLVTGLKKYGKSIGLTVRDSIEGTHDIPRKIEETLWRVGQEAFNNVYKHAETEEVNVQLTTNSQGVYFKISDEGKGFHLERTMCRQNTIGLSSMQERVELVGGTFTIKSFYGKGTEISINIPW